MKKKTISKEVLMNLIEHDKETYIGKKPQDYLKHLISHINLEFEGGKNE